jgi:hypothetical protein
LRLSERIEGFVAEASESRSEPQTDFAEGPTATDVGGMTRQDAALATAAARDSALDDKLREALETFPSPLQTELAYVGLSARRRERRSYLFLGLLVGVGAAAVGAGVVADSDIFWGVAGGAFFMAAAGIVAYAASSLGIFAEMLELIRRNPPEH